MRGLIVTADDFGLHERVNEAVERAHREGVLDCASLMVSGPAARDAIDRARRLPRLRVGLHIVLADGAPTSPLHAIPALVDTNGRFGDRMVRDGFRFFFLPYVRRQLAREIRAQFEAFAATGLELDHVNTHKHFHLHPTVLSLILDIGKAFGLRAMRLPREMSGPSLLAPWAALMKARLERAGIAHNDWVAGIASTGRMNEATMLDLLARAPDGVLEVYSHPAIDEAAPITHAMRDYRHADELAALCSPRVAQAIAATGAKRGAFSDVFAA
ncbi:cellobiose phosphotransferase system celC [Candidatus Burkholderia verschuerenii]|uniref:Cellobiose phosphotransferase system celC n=1 Tax=Candidatus Burkholderia verschuerenii TaxID=242163 RepID=A0A0L0MAA7_9BURK|nr:hopanoid biosynthesis-associated protein HpnK [Candidatus Burkholderia verschuerenii]KND59215.1 cellobiose phosphotransferase system celC [Candidatus Burkholderia verschuerenii]